MAGSVFDMGIKIRIKYFNKLIDQLSKLCMIFSMDQLWFITFVEIDHIENM